MVVLSKPLPANRGALFVLVLCMGILGGLFVRQVIGETEWTQPPRTGFAAGSDRPSSSSEGSIFAVETGVADILTALTPKPSPTPTVRPPTTPTKTPMPFLSPTPTPLPTQAMKGQSAKCCEG